MLNVTHDNLKIHVSHPCTGQKSQSLTKHSAGNAVHKQALSYMASESEKQDSQFGGEFGNMWQNYTHSLYYWK